MVRRLPALCGGGGRAAAATRVVRRKRVQRGMAYSSPSNKQLAVAALASGGGGGGGGGGKSSRSGSPGGGGGGCYVNGNGALMVEVGGGGGAGGKRKDGGGRRVMVLADGRAEAAGALQWALSQAVRSNDTVVLLTVVKPVAQDVSDSCVKMLGTKSQQHLEALKTLCESTRPEVKVETCAVEAEERAPAVVEAARRHGASLLVLGQRRRRAVARWMQALWRRRWRVGSTGVGGAAAGGTMVEYCIEHAPCAALAVRRRSSGGYLVSSKRHKDFWLLA